MACTMMSHDMLGPSPRGDSGMAPPSYVDVPQSGPGIRNKAWHRVGPPAPQATMTDLRHAGSDFHTFTSPSSRPINDFDSDAGSEVFGHSAQGLPPVSPSSSHASLMQHASTFNPYQQAGFQAVAQHHLSQNATATATLSRNASMAVREPAGVLTVVGHANSLTPAAPGFDPSARPSMERSSAAKFRTDLMVARTGSNAMDRYKALTRLLSSVKRDMAAVGMDQPFKAASWGIQHHELLCRIVEIGEALSGFGTADFGERSNSSRAINTKDYAYLLKMYGEAHWGMYRQEFIEAMPHAMQDEMWTVRGLLTVRFEANAIIQDQLMKHVGLEPGGGQGAVVYNTSVVTANPVNSVSSKPNNQVHAYAASAAKVVQNSSHKLGMIAVASVAGLWMIKRTGMLGFVPGMGRPRGRRSRDDMSDETSGPSRRGGRGGGGRGGLSHDERLLLAFDHVDRSFKELNKAQRNIDLLKGDWRLGNFRLTSPFGGPDPPGFEAVDLPACEPRQFMHMQLGY